MQIQEDWKVRVEGELSSDLVEKYGNIVGAILRSRGVTDLSAAEEFLNPKLSNLKSPFRLTNLESACRRIAQALNASEIIAIYGDYDIDGMSALSILTSYFEAISYDKIIKYIPHRFEEGYGVHVAALEKLKSSGASLVITVDTGITAVNQVLKAKELGLELIITDHHLPGPVLPDTPWIVNPNSGVCSSDLKYLSGAGVAFYLCLGMNIVLREMGYFEARHISPPNMKNFLDLYSLGTISDQMKLIGDNRILVSAGLKLLLKSERPGVRELVRACIDLEKKQITARDVGFSIGPKLNAASRMGQATLSVELLSCRDFSVARELSEKLLLLNTSRIAIQDKVFQEAFAQAKHQSEVIRAPVIVVSGPWHEGVLGIVASKLVETFSRPVIVLAEHNGVLKGSMRSVTGVSCVELLNSSSKFIDRFGGHAEAAGLQIQKNQFDDFLEDIWIKSGHLLHANSFAKEFYYDMELPNNLRVEDVLALEMLAPFGQGNPEPSFLVKGLSCDREFKFLKEKHLKFKTDEELEVIGFFMAQSFEEIRNQGATHLDLIVVPEINRFRGLSKVQLRLERIRPRA